MAVDPRKRYLDRLKKAAADSTAHVDQVIFLAAVEDNTPTEIFILGDVSNEKRLDIADGEAALLTVDAVLKKAVDGSVSAEQATYTVKRVGATVTVAAVGAAGTVVAVTAGTAAVVLTLTAPTAAEYSAAVRVNKLSAAF